MSACCLSCNCMCNVFDCRKCVVAPWHALLCRTLKDSGEVAAAEPLSVQSIMSSFKVKKDKTLSTQTSFRPTFARSNKALEAGTSSERASSSMSLLAGLGVPVTQAPTPNDGHAVPAPTVITVSEEKM